MNVARAQEFYDMGKAAALRYSALRDALMRDNLAWDVTPDDLICYEAGFCGTDKPRKVYGWRYGNLPASERSYNYAEGKSESGVSLVGTLEGDMTQDKLSAHFCSIGRPIVWVTGWLNTVRRGGDGEPLVFGAREVRP